METRNKTIKQFVEQYINDSNVSEQTYASNVVETYIKRTAEAERSINFNVGGDVFKDAKANAQKMRRYLNGDVRLPCELEEAIVLALPADWRESLLVSLAARYGLLAAPIPTSTDCDVENMGKLLKELGDVFNAVSPALVDGVINDADAPHAHKILKEINDAQALLTSLAIKVTKIARRPSAKIHTLSTVK